MYKLLKRKLIIAAALILMPGIASAGMTLWCKEVYKCQVIETGNGLSMVCGNWLECQVINLP